LLRPPNFRHEHIDQEHKYRQDQRDPEAPADGKIRDDTGANEETERDGTDRTPGPDPKPDAHATTMSSDVMLEYDLLVWICTLQRGAEQVEQSGLEVHVREAHD